MSWNWDVNNTLPATSEKDTLETRSINLMCYLTQDITFNELYAQPFDAALDRIVSHLAVLPGYLDNDAHKRNISIKSDLLYHLENLRRLLRSRIPAAEDRVECRQFFHGRTFNSPGGRTRLYHETVKELGRVRANRNLDHVCIPFMPMQQGNGLINIAEMDGFLQHIGDKTLFNLFTEAKASYSKHQRNAIAAAKKCGILRTSIDAISDKGDFQVMIVNLKNNHKCVGGVCQPNHPGSWCNADDNNNCTAASD